MQMCAAVTLRVGKHLKVPSQFTCNRLCPETELVTAVASGQTYTTLPGQLLHTENELTKSDAAKRTKTNPINSKEASSADTGVKNQPKRGRQENMRLQGTFPKLLASEGPHIKKCGCSLGHRQPQQGKHRTQAPSVCVGVCEQATVFTAVHPIHEETK